MRDQGETVETTGINYAYGVYYKKCQGKGTVVRNRYKAKGGLICDLEWKIFQGGCILVGATLLVC